MAPSCDRNPLLLPRSPPNTLTMSQAADGGIARAHEPPTPPPSPTDSTYCSDVEHRLEYSKIIDCKTVPLSCPNAVPESSSERGRKVRPVAVDQNPLEPNVNSGAGADPQPGQGMQPKKAVVADSPPSAITFKELQDTFSGLATKVAILTEESMMIHSKFKVVQDENIALRTENKEIRDELNNLLNEIDDLQQVTDDFFPFIRDYYVATRPRPLKRKRADLEDGPVDSEEPAPKRQKTDVVSSE
jgi:hypothetical protein